MKLLRDLPSRVRIPFHMKRFIRNENGSASVEFSILAIPLFIPLFIFITQFSTSTDSQESLRTLARESVRAFVSSSNDEIAYQVANQVVERGGKILGHDDIKMRVRCSSSPCISPDSQITVTLISKESLGLNIEVSVIEYVSPWA
jgi:Flp pilus assembly protein TadG